MIEAPYGHDCFLLEEARQTPIIRASWASTAWPKASDGDIEEEAS